MYFTLAISAATREGCAGLVAAALGTDPRVLPIPGPVAVAWRAPDERAAVLRWGLLGDDGPAAASHEGTIWADASAVHARTGLARVDPVYLTEVPGAVLVCDRASWAASVAGRSGDHDPVMIGAFLSMGYPIGAATPFRGVRALGRDRSLTVTGGCPGVTRSRDRDASRGEVFADLYEPVGGAVYPAKSGRRIRETGSCTAGRRRGMDGRRGYSPSADSQTAADPHCRAQAIRPRGAGFCLCRDRYVPIVRLGRDVRSTGARAPRRSRRTHHPVAHVRHDRTPAGVPLCRRSSSPSPQ